MDSVDLSGAKILLVDDTPTNLTVLWRALEGEAYEVMVVTSGTQALQVVRRERPDLILLDVMMPDMDGFETCRRLQEDDATRDIPVIFITARDDTDLESTHRISRPSRGRFSHGRGDRWGSCRGPSTA
jgi:CheY-like chemotaxis protein